MKYLDLALIPLTAPLTGYFVRQEDDAYPAKLGLLTVLRLETGLETMQKTLRLIVLSFTLFTAQANALLASGSNVKGLNVWDFGIGEQVDDALRKLASICADYDKHFDYIVGYGCISKFTGDLNVSIQLIVDRRMLRSDLVQGVSYQFSAKDTKDKKVTGRQFEYFGDEYLKFKESPDYATPSKTQCSNTPVPLDYDMFNDYSGVSRNVVNAFISSLPKGTERIIESSCRIRIYSARSSSHYVDFTQVFLESGSDRINAKVEFSGFVMKN